MESGGRNCPLWICGNVLESGAKKNWPDDKESLASIEKQWTEPFGDMRQELVFIGQNLDRHNMVKALDACLLSEEEVLRGKSYWQTLSDPFPSWEQK